MDHVRRIVIGLGSNLGDRAGNLRSAIDELRKDRELHVLRTSPMYETEPVGGPPQGDYLNAAVLVVSALDASDLFERMLVIERKLGRVRPDPVRSGPRTIDLDLLWIEGELVEEPALVVPHPRLRERAFALRPLLDLAADARDPRDGTELASLPAALVELRRPA